MKTDLQASAKKQMFGMAVAMAAAIGMPQQANAYVMPVYDAAVHAATSATAGTVAIGIILDEFRNNQNGDHYYNTDIYYQKFEDHFTKIDTNIKNIDTNITKIDTNITNIDTNIEKHFDYTKNISIINNNYYGNDDGIEPIPWEMVTGLDPVPMEDYLENFKNAAAYEGAACFSGNCDKDDMLALQQAQAYGVDAQKKTNDAMLRTVEFQRASLGDEGKRLEFLSEKALADPEETGQRKQMQLALQLANEQGNHLLKMRQAMLQSQSAEVVREHVANDTRAKQVASAQSLRRPVSFEPATAPTSSF